MHRQNSQMDKFKKWTKRTKLREWVNGKKDKLHVHVPCMTVNSALVIA